MDVPKNSAPSQLGWLTERPAVLCRADAPPKYLYPSARPFRATVWRGLATDDGERFASSSHSAAFWRQCSARDDGHHVQTKVERSTEGTIAPTGGPYGSPNSDGRVRLYTMNGADWSKRYPLIVDAAAHIKGNAIIGLDGVADFDALHSRANENMPVLAPSIS